MKRLLTLTAALVLTVLAAVGIAPAVSAQEAGSGIAVVHRVDAAEETAEVTLLASDYTVGTGDVSVVQEGAAVAVSSVRTATALNRSREIVFVVDASAALATGDIFETATDAIAAQIRRLPAGTQVAVVSAGDTALVEVAMTDNLDRAAADVEAIDLSRSGALFNAITRASLQFSEDVDTIKTVVVFSGAADTGSSLTAEDARSGLVQQGAQLVAVRYQSGEAGLDSIIAKTGGATFSASNAAETVSAIGDATTVASDRLVVTFPGVLDRTIRTDVELTVNSTVAAFSYAGGTLTFRPIALTPSIVREPSGISFFRTDNGKYAAIGLTFLAMGLGAFALGSLFASGETSLEGLINRYSGEGDAAALSEEESAIVQTALVKRAVELSESFAEDRGFLVKVEGMLERAKLPLRAGEAMSIYFGIIVFGAILGYFFFGGLIGSLIMIAVTAALQVAVVNFMARRRMRKFEQQLPDTLQLLAGTLRAGYSLPQGLEAVSNEIADPMGYELRRVMTEARLGRELEDSLASTAERLDSPDFAWAVMAIGIQREVGGNLNELLMTVSDTMIARERLKGEVAALTAEGKMSAILLGGLPPGLGLVMWIMNREYINQLFVTTLGNIFLGLGVVSSLIGFAWMKKVITINV